MKNSRRGFVPVVIVLAVVALFALAGGGVWYYSQSVKPKPAPAVGQQPNQPNTAGQTNSQPEQNPQVNATTPVVDQQNEPKSADQTDTQPQAPPANIATSPVQSVQSIGKIKGTIDDLVARNISAKCTYAKKDDTTGTTDSFTIYAAGGQVRFDNAESHDKTGIFGTEHELYRDGYLYTYTEGYSGWKNDVGQMTNVNKIKTVAKNHFSLGQMMGSTSQLDLCTDWTADSTIFAVPSSIVFEDMTDLTMMSYEYMANPNGGNNQERGDILGTIDDLAKHETPLKCTYSTLQNSIASDWIVYVADGQARVDFKQTNTDKSVVSKIMIIENDILYRWNGGYANVSPNSGEKIDINELKGEIDLQILMETLQTSYEVVMGLPGEQVYTCTSWSADRSMFLVPSNIKFQDVTGQIKPKIPPCIKEGQAIDVFDKKMQCCAGLQPIINADKMGMIPYKQSDLGICANCGDKICGKNENQYNCPEDCGFPTPVASTVNSSPDIILLAPGNCTTLTCPYGYKETGLANSTLKVCEDNYGAISAKGVIISGLCSEISETNDKICCVSDAK